MACERVAIIGSRNWTDVEAVERAVDEVGPKSIVITGCCPTGVDQMVYDYCMRIGRVCVRAFAPWRVQGRAAGPIRNSVIERLSTRVIAFDLGGSGTRNCVGRFRTAGKPIDVR